MKSDQMTGFDGPYVHPNAERFARSCNNLSHLLLSLGRPFGFEKTSVNWLALIKTMVKPSLQSLINTALFLDMTAKLSLQHRLL
jgi:hypothetical protein